MTAVDTLPWLASVGAGRWQMSGILAAQRAGMRVLAMDGDANAPGLATADHGVVVDIRDPQSVIDAVAESNITLAGAISFAAEVGVRAVGALRVHFSLPGPGLQVLHQLTDKAAQRRTWEEAGLRNPVFWRIVESVDAGLTAIADAEAPVIVKPVDSAGSRGVTRLETHTSRNHRSQALAHAISGSRSQRAIVESVLPGKEYTVETFADGDSTYVLAITVKEKVPDTGGTVANELATPTDSPKTQRSIAALAVDALEAVGYRDGPGHVEIMHDPTSGPALVEAAGRGAGFMVFEGLVPAASGYDIVTSTARRAIGATVNAPSIARQAVVLRFFPSARGQVIGFSGFEDANSLPGVEANPFVKVGDRISRAQSDGDRLGYILATGADPHEARARANTAEKLIRFDIAADD